LIFTDDYGWKEIVRQIVFVFAINFIGVIGIFPFFFPDSFNSSDFWSRIIQNPIYRLLFVVGMLAVMVIEEIWYSVRYKSKKEKEKQSTLERSEI
jgi:predicted membrane channel-forming protein YqfA (hemolysin III family)